MSLKSGVVAISAVAALSVSGAALWFQESAYRQPTPIPVGFRQPELGTDLSQLTSRIGIAQGRPVLLHFMSTSCSCSKFQFDHLLWLQSRFASNVDVIVMLEGGTKPDEIRRLGFPGRIFADEDARIATEAGVYATPQAVLLDEHSRIYFRGNYNSSRFCADPETEFVRIAIQALLAGTSVPQFPPSATKAFGCTVPRLSFERRAALR